MTGSRQSHWSLKKGAVVHLMLSNLPLELGASLAPYSFSLAPSPFLLPPLTLGPRGIVRPLFACSFFSSNLFFPPYLPSPFLLPPLTLGPRGIVRPLFARPSLTRADSREQPGSSYDHPVWLFARALAVHVLTERRRTLLDDARQIKRGKSPNLRVRPEAASLRESTILTY